MARVEVTHHPRYGDLLTGPAPIIRGTYFQPLEEVRLEVSCQGHNGYPWKSLTTYKTDSAGVFDTSIAPDAGEGYSRDAADKPFTSMVCQHGAGHDFSGTDLGHIEYGLSCYDQHGDKIWSSAFSRYLGRDARCVPEPRANILLFDDEIRSDEYDTMLALAPYGVGVLGHSHALAECTKTVPAQSNLPTFIVASGRASARALEYAIAKPELEGVILFSGAGLRFDPIEQLDYLLLDIADLQSSETRNHSTRNLYRQATAIKDECDKVSVKVEGIACPLYMFSGLDDQVWPSAHFCEKIARRRQDLGCPYPTMLRTFEGVGHDIGPSLGLPSLPTSERSIGLPSTDFRFLTGGDMERQARARRDCWLDLLRILAGETPGHPMKSYS